MQQTSPKGENSMEHIRVFRNELPMLRRCGRALTGLQSFADIAAVQLMNEMLADNGRQAPLNFERTGLYSKYLDVLKLTVGTDQAADDERFPSPLPWQCAWLTVVEGFSDDEAAEILNISVRDFAGMLAAYRIEVAHQAPATVQIIEDEFLIARDLKRIVTSMGHVVTGVARTRQTAVDMFRHNKPALILSDVFLADGSSGIDAAQEIKRDDAIHIVFITAFPEQLLQGQNGEPEYLIAKPFDQAVVEATVSQALRVTRTKKWHKRTS
jgi:CheY-like chemotaxis protein